VTVPATGSLCLALGGRTLAATGRRSLGAFAALAAAALGQQRLAAATEAGRAVAEADRMRTALLAAVSHDLRTPLAAAQAAVSCLRSGDIPLTAEDHNELLATADESLEQLAYLVTSLLDVSDCRPGRCQCFPGQPISGRSSRAHSMASDLRRGPSRWTSRPTCPRSWPIRRSWSGSS